MSAESGPSFQHLGMLSRYVAPNRNDNHGAYPSDSTKKKYDKMTWKFAHAGANSGSLPLASDTTGSRNDVGDTTCEQIRLCKGSSR
jgi:hypothetical protein